MKKIFVVFSLIIFSFIILNFSYAKDTTSFIGRWAEKTSERVVMDIFQDQDSSAYQIFITWREDNLAQKDIYRFKAKEDKDGILNYKDGIHIIRTYNADGTFADETDYTDGSGTVKVENNEIIWLDNKSQGEKTTFIPANNSFLKDTTVKNRFLSLMLPHELKGFYEVQTKRNCISVFDKTSKEAGFGGYAFGICSYKKPSDHAMMPGGRKIGEFTTRFGTIYDVVLSQPTDVQYDYVNGIADSYALLYSIGEAVNLKGIHGNRYVKNQGMKGQDLYKEVLQRHITAINEKWDSIKLENEKMSYMYNVLAQSNNKVLDKVGYTYYDTNGDGVDELLIGEIAQGEWKGVVYDIYTMVNRKPAHVISGGTRNRYYVCDNFFLCNEYSSGAKESGWLVYILVENSTELYPQIGFKYDEYEEKATPWFISYDFLNNKWVNVSEHAFKERKSVFDKYQRFDFVPLSEFK